MNTKTRFALCLTFSLMLAAASGAAMAQAVWTGSATIGDIHREQFARAVQAHGKAVQSKAQLGTDIAAARAAFFKTADKPADRPPAEKRFADLLQAKDFTYLLMLAAEGTGQQGRKRNDAINLLTGGHIDGGIAPSARGAFDNWVEAVRRSMGARSPDQLLIVTDGDKLASAVQANVDSYEAYKRLRDQFEIDRYKTGNAVEAALTKSGSFKLNEQSTGAFRTSEDTRIDLVTQNRELRNRLAALTQAGQPVLRCAYGPVGTWNDGKPKYEHYNFWLKRPPDGIDELLAMDTQGALGRMATRAALEACPETTALAKSAAGVKERTSTSMGARSSLDTGMIQRQLRPEPQAAPPAPAADQAAQRSRERLEAMRQTRAGQRASANERHCASMQGSLQRARDRQQAMPAEAALRMQPQIDAMARGHAQRCGGF